MVSIARGASDNHKSCLNYADNLNVAWIIASDCGYGVVTEGFVPDTSGVVAFGAASKERGLDKEEVQAALCPAPRPAAGAGINTDAPFVRYAQECDNPPSEFCLVQGTC